MAHRIHSRLPMLITYVPVKQSIVLAAYICLSVGIITEKPLIRNRSTWYSDHSLNRQLQWLRL